MASYHFLSSIEPNYFPAIIANQTSYKLELDWAILFYFWGSIEPHHLSFECAHCTATPLLCQAWFKRNHHSLGVIIVPPPLVCQVRSSYHPTVFFLTRCRSSWIIPYLVQHCCTNLLILTGLIEPNYPLLSAITNTYWVRSSYDLHFARFRAQHSIIDFDHLQIAKLDFQPGIQWMLTILFSFSWSDIYLLCIYHNNMAFPWARLSTSIIYATRSSHDIHSNRFWA